MKLDVVFLLAVCVASAFAGASVKVSARGQLKNDSPIKREGTVSSVGVGYHGPSFKYLPPSSTSSLGGYEGYSSQGHQGSYAGLSGYNFGGLKTAAGPTEIGNFGGTSSPKVETFIVQTQPAHVDQNVLHGASGSNYDEHSIPFNGGYSVSHSGSNSGFSSGNAYGHSIVHKIMPVVGRSPGYSSGSQISSGFSHFGGSGGSFKHSKGLAGVAHSLSDSSPIYIQGSAHLAGGSYVKRHPGLVRHYGGLHSVSVGSPINYGLKNHEHGSSDQLHSLLEAAYRESSYSGGQGGYSYEEPVPSNAHGAQHIPATSYGVPVTDLSPPYHAEGPADISVQHLPSYSAGHKGLGHFGFTSSKPQALHTDYIGSNKYENSILSHGGHGGSHDNEHIEIQSHFKPSLFLGASHESSGIPSEYRAPTKIGHGPSTHYLPPPTSEGYDYPPPSALYSTRSHAHAHSSAESSGLSHDPEAVYLPPAQSNYGSPSLPEDTYLPPHH